VSDDALTRETRNALVARIRDTEARLYPKEGEPEPAVDERARLREAYYLALGEYFDRLPRVVMSVCPFTGQPLKRAWDPWGLDGFWWHGRLLTTIDEPRAPGTFRVLLGGLALAGRVPAEAVETVTAGPEIPFVVPRLLELPGMVAVVHRLTLETGDTAYPVAYFSEEEIDPSLLHQHWLRADLWYKDEDGAAGWIIANDAWDFDLAPWLASGKLRWLREGPKGPEASEPAVAKECPYAGLSGQPMQQIIVDGERELVPPPNGVPFDPFQE